MITVIPIPTLATTYSYAPTYYGDTGGLAAPADVPPQLPPTTMSTAPMGPEQQQAAGDALQFYSKARAAFLQDDYRDALRLAEHSAVEAPGNSKVHELISLALFAQGNYRAAASEAHAAMALGPIADWNDLFGYYNDAQNYTAAKRFGSRKVHGPVAGPGKGDGGQSQIGRRPFSAGLSLPDDRRPRQREGRVRRCSQAHAGRQAGQPLPRPTPGQRAAHAAEDAVNASRQTALKKSGEVRRVGPGACDPPAHRSRVWWARACSSRFRLTAKTIDTDFVYVNSAFEFPEPCIPYFCIRA